MAEAKEAPVAAPIPEVKVDESKPVIKTGKKGQILRFGEHDIRLVRRELHLAVDEELRFTPEQKEIRKQLLDKVLVGCLQLNNMEEALDTHKSMIRSQNKKIMDIKIVTSQHQAQVDSLAAQKKGHLQQISELKNNVKYEKERGAAMDSDLSEANISMEPLKKANSQLMNIIQAAEKGHNLLLNTMTEINNEIGSVM